MYYTFTHIHILLVSPSSYDWRHLARRLSVGGAAPPLRGFGMHHAITSLRYSASDTLTWKSGPSPQELRISEGPQEWKLSPTQTNNTHKAKPL